MGMAMLTVGALLAPLRNLAARIGHAPQARSGARQVRLPAARFAMAPAPRPPGVPRDLAHRPVRVVRVKEAARAPAGAGRMFISGRMADVCAELDRLAALEGQASWPPPH